MVNEKKPDTPQALIRSAWRLGKKQVVINNRLFDLEIQRKNPTIHVGGKSFKVKEQWIIATPADGKKLPLYSVDYNNKLRSSLA
jgi:hypothetical protein